MDRKTTGFDRGIEPPREIKNGDIWLVVSMVAFLVCFFSGLFWIIHKMATTHGAASDAAIILVLFLLIHS